VTQHLHEEVLVPAIRPHPSIPVTHSVVTPPPPPPPPPPDLGITTAARAPSTTRQNTQQLSATPWMQDPLPLYARVRPDLSTAARKRVAVYGRRWQQAGEPSLTCRSASASRCPPSRTRGGRSDRWHGRVCQLGRGGACQLGRGGACQLGGAGRVSWAGRGVSVGAGTHLVVSLAPGCGGRT
jgi:hypothetical protein